MSKMNIQTKLEVTEVVSQLGLEIEGNIVESVVTETTASVSEAVEEKIQEQTKEEKTNKRKSGKKVEWYVKGELKQEFPSIKAATVFFKDSLELKTMPFTPIMNSIREDKDWNENSFKFAVVEETLITEEKVEEKQNA